MEESAAELSKILKKKALKSMQRHRDTSLNKSIHEKDEKDKHSTG